MVVKTLTKQFIVIKLMTIKTVIKSLQNNYFQIFKTAGIFNSLPLISYYTWLKSIACTALKLVPFGL